MKSLVPILALTVLFTGCVSSSATLDPSLVGKIPEGANLVVLESDQAVGDLYRAAYQQLASNGYEITEHNEEMGTISTAFNEIGQETLLSIRVFVQEHGSGSTAQLRGRWGAGQELVMFTSMLAGVNTSVMQGQPAEWRQRNRAGVAFGQLARLAKDIPHCISTSAGFPLLRRLE